MKKLRITSPLNMHPGSKENLSQYIKEGLLFHKEMGFDGVDFGVGLVDVNAEGWQARAEQAVADAKEIGMPFEVGHLPFIGGGGTKDPEVLRAFSEKMFKAIDAAKIIGMKYAVMHPNAVTVPMRLYNKTEQYDIVMSHLAPFVEYANKVGVTVVVENMRQVHGPVASHRYGQSPEDLCEIADALGIGVCWDFGHAHISGLKQSEGIAYVGKRLKVLHVNDNFGGDDIHLVPFGGNIDWKDAMHGLALVGFEGVFNFEAGAGRLPALPTMRRMHAKYLLEAAAVLMSYIE